MDLKLLEDIGLTEGEVKVYLALFELGTTKTGALALKAGVSSSKVYKILDRLEKKGLAGHALKGKIKFYTALEAERIIDYIEDKERDLNEKKLSIKKIIGKLEEKRKKSKKTTEVTLCDGFKATTNLFRNVLDALKPGETYYNIGAGYGDVKNLRDFFYKYHIKRAQKKIKLMMLANHDIKDTIEETTKVNSEIRFLPQYLITNMEIVFYGNKTFIPLWTEDPKGILIESEEIAESFKKYFDTLWKIAK